jgi:hypothetical protein
VTASSKSSITASAVVAAAKAASSDVPTIMSVKELKRMVNKDDDSSSLITAAAAAAASSAPPALAVAPVVVTATAASSDMSADDWLILVNADSSSSLTPAAPSSSTVDTTAQKLPIPMFKTTNSKRVMVGESTLFLKRPSTPSSAAAANNKMKNAPPSSTALAAAAPVAPSAVPAASTAAASTSPAAPAAVGKIVLLPGSEGAEALLENKRLLEAETKRINREFNSKKRKLASSTITIEKSRKAQKVGEKRKPPSSTTTGITIGTSRKAAKEDTKKKLPESIEERINEVRGDDEEEENDSSNLDEEDVSDEDNMRGNNRLNAELNAEDVIDEGTAGGGQMETAGGGVVTKSVVYNTYDDKQSVFVVSEITTMADLKSQFRTGVEVPAGKYAEARNILVHYVTSYFYAAVIVKQREHEEVVIDREKNKKRLLTKGTEVAVAEKSLIIEENCKMPLMKILDVIGTLLITFRFIICRFILLSF